MKLAIIFWCYKHVEICVARLQLLRHYNPTAPIYVLFGGDPAEAPNFEAEFLPYINDFYCYPEQRNPLWKYWHGDMLISQWFTDRGHVLEWDSVAIIQWDMLVFDSVERIFSCVKEGQVLVSHARPAAQDVFRTSFLQNTEENRVEYQKFLTEYHLTDDDVWWSAFVVVVFPRAFLDRFSRRPYPEIGFLEYTIPTLAKSWGFDVNTNHRYGGYREDLPTYYDVVSPGKTQIPNRHILLHLLDPWGFRIFHPCWQQLRIDRLAPALPAWLNFLRCSEWDYAELFGESVRSVTQHAIAGYDLSLPDPVTARPAICLSMIVHNDAHRIGQTLDSVAPYISSWVIVDTGADDGTQDLITSRLAGLGIHGELYQRPWRGLGQNRVEALTLAQDRGDYIWVLDAGDTLEGRPDFTQLGASLYWLRNVDENGDSFWRAQLFRDGLRVRYQGVEEYVAADDDHPCVGLRLNDASAVRAGLGSAKTVDPQQRFARDRDLLLAEEERSPQDASSVSYLAQSYFELGDFANARKWYEQRTEIRVNHEEVYYALFRIAECMAQLGEPWPAVQDAYLRAWEFRPHRAEALHAIAVRYRSHQQHQLSYLFAERAAKIPFPEFDQFCVHADIYTWRATDEQAVCASWIGKPAEAFALWRSLLTRADLPDYDRQRIAANRDVCVSSLLNAAAAYPEALVARLVSGPRDGDVVCSLVAGPDRASSEATLNSFLRCCTDIERVGRFLVLDTGLSAPDRALLQDRYGFLEFCEPAPFSELHGPSAQLAQLRPYIHERLWLQLGQSWRFFAPENLIARLTAVLEAEPQVFQVAINLSDATTLIGTSAREEAIRRAPGTGRYLLTETVADGPALFETGRLDLAGRQTASLDEVLCIQGTAGSESAEPDI